MRKRYFALAVAILILGLSSIAVSEEAIPLREDRYAPRRLGMPDAISGYSVLAVLTEDNFECMQPGEKRLILQAPQPTIEDALRDFPKEHSGEESQALNLTEDGQWRWSMVGPGVTREQIVSQLDQAYRSFKANGC